jgi:hypothetical protein
MEIKNGWSKKFIIWVILRHGNGSRMKFYLTLIIPKGYESDTQNVSLNFIFIVLLKTNPIYISGLNSLLMFMSRDVVTARR